jgi:endonuclease/exonuclease/phosphatase family metal-dependent hydrolase/predicted esterase
MVILQWVKFVFQINNSCTMFKSILSILVFIFFYLTSFGQEIKVISWNIRYDNKNDGQDQWKNRKKELVGVVKTENPDFFGIQEGLFTQVSYLDKKLKNFKYIGVGRDDGKEAGEMMALFYNKNKWKPLQTGNFWLSDTPDQVSRGWDAACNRITSYGIFYNKMGDTVAVYNTHLDHIGVEARKNSITQLNQLTKSNKFPKILMGDFNFNPSNELYNLTTSVWADTRLATKFIQEDQEGTFNGFKVDSRPKDRIDYIFTDHNWLVKNYSSMNKFSQKGRHLSDHNLVVASLTISKNPTYLQRWHLSNSDTLPYRVAYPKKFDHNEKYPLVIFLHGAGERGNDNNKQLSHGAKLFLDSMEKYPAIVVFPQCKQESYWASVDIKRAPGNNEFTFKNSEQPTLELKKVISLLEKLKTSESIDQTRIYIGGLSMGGMGTWEMLWRMPNTFAAAIPICGGGYAPNTNHMVNTPIWAFHGDSDSVVDIKYSTEMVESLQSKGGKPKFTVYKGVNHDSWSPAFAEPDLLKWLFSNQLK